MSPENRAGTVTAERKAPARAESDVSRKTGKVVRSIPAPVPVLP